MIEKLYIIPSYNCNLHCQHCDIKDNINNVDIEKFIDKLKTIEFENGILFGGEPLLLENRYFKEILSLQNVNSISTNLLLLDKDKINIIKKNNIKVATSWNPKRFTSSEYKTWLYHIKLLEIAKIDVTVLITLTEDIIDSNIFYVLDDLTEFDNIIGIKLEPFVLSSNDLIKKLDSWLCETLEKWNKYKFAHCLKDDYQIGNINLCKNVWTLKPNTELTNSCPTGDYKIFLEKCLKCKYRSVCKPCMKQEVCTFFENFYLRINDLCQ